MLKELISEVDVCLNLIGILHEKGKVNTFKNIHSNFPKKLAEICNLKKVKLIHISALGLENAKDSEYAKSKLDGEGKILKNFPKDWKTPIIMAGGAGNANHFIEGLQEKKIDAVATAHLFNFIGDGLSIARKKVIEQGIDLATWYNLEDFKSILNKPTK